MSSFRGKSIVLVFYPADETPICTTQWCEFRDYWLDVQKRCSEINPGSAEKHQEFRKSKAFPFPLIVDEGQKIAELYHSDAWFVPKRTVYLIGPDGTVKYAKLGKPEPRDFLAAAQQVVNGGDARDFSLKIMIFFIDAPATSRRLLRAICFLAMSFSVSNAQQRFYAGLLGGISTPSADAQFVMSATGQSASSYKPSNGGVVSTFGGVHLNDYLSLQANYSWNRNDLLLFATKNPDDSYEQRRHSSQYGPGADVLLYFRNRHSWVRPFLSAGAGVTRFKSDSASTAIRRGNINPPPDSFSSVNPSLRVAVGIDIRIRHGWAFRYSFLEAIQTNPISPLLSPPGERKLANFQNLFGIVWISGK